MKNVTKKLFLLLVVSVIAFVSKATITYRLSISKLYADGYGSVYYMKSVFPSGDVEHFMDCAEPGNLSCCWPTIPVIKKSGVLYSYEAIHDYVMAQISQQNMHGEILYEGKVPVSWNVTNKGEATISIESDTDKE
ncbi:MAG: hypothetical protein P0Y49_09170 [Candidatus Pedobacter colombiensis]|uniref:Uncharacterized protein n=1 Tax=Candidatus Pedobacter colombiensis TaxID=3121371 RepID=A0AAJ5WD24_9SPHI|nr:hypothetical protein [Pedobacter sp.]WEK21310.1 MAG: hypothetical protein P0Y49_09170 [Pedobacter sp.]